MTANTEFAFQNVGFSFEKNFNCRSWLEFFDANWTYSIYIGLVYLIVIFGLVRFMKNRPALYLNWPVALWSLIETVLNAYSTYRLWQDYFLYRGLRVSESPVCQGFSCNTEVYCLAMVVFCLVKPLILMDTIFIVLRKQKLPFVNYYHHFNVLIFAWYCAARRDSVGRYFIISNCTADVVVYGYRFLKATRLFHIPRFVRTSVILAMLLNLVVLFVSNYQAYHYRIGGEFAAKSDFIQKFVMFFSSSYFVLFFHQFFFN